MAGSGVKPLVRVVIGAPGAVAVIPPDPLLSAAVRVPTLT